MSWPYGIFSACPVMLLGSNVDGSTSISPVPISFCKVAIESASFEPSKRGLDVVVLHEFIFFEECTEGCREGVLGSQCICIMNRISGGQPRFENVSSHGDFKLSLVAVSANELTAALVMSFLMLKNPLATIPASRKAGDVKTLR